MFHIPQMKIQKTGEKSLQAGQIHTESFRTNTLKELTKSHGHAQYQAHLFTLDSRPVLCIYDHSHPREPNSTVLRIDLRPEPQNQKGPEHAIVRCDTVTWKTIHGGDSMPPAESKFDLPDHITLTDIREFCKNYQENNPSHSSYNSSCFIRDLYKKLDQEYTESSTDLGKSSMFQEQTGETDSGTDSTFPKWTAKSNSESQSVFKWSKRSSQRDSIHRSSPGREWAERPRNNMYNFDTVDTVLDNMSEDLDNMFSGWETKEDDNAYRVSDQSLFDDLLELTL